MNNEQIKKYISMRMALWGNLLTSDICGNKCLFCSNNHNPEEVNVIKVGNRKKEDLFDEIKFFPKNIKRIHMGETTFNTTEGDILEYPYFKELILEIKKQRPSAKIILTTGGNSLTDDVIYFLKENNISLIISIHSINPEIRAKITGNTLERANIAINGLKKCLQEKIKIEAIRLVPMAFMPNEDIYNTLKFLIENNIECVDIWVASFSKFAKKEEITNLKDECDRIAKIILTLKDIFKISKSNTIIRLYPFGDFNKIQNVFSNSYAEDIGLQIGDEIIEINNTLIINGDHAMNLLYNTIFIEKMIVKRDNTFILLKNLNGPMIAENIFINCIVEHGIIQDIYNNIKQDMTHSLVITSEASYPIIKQSLERMGLFENNNINLVCAKNESFGGNICVNGLITIEDYLKTLNKYREKHPNTHITKIIIACTGFRMGRERDVTGRSLQDLRTEGCVDVILV
ncbi:MAG: DUF512 domain-containing protein [Firmicutes bacterium]|nr:DUF512 domain-containing protein [Bacillota bacterium]